MLVGKIVKKYIPNEKIKNRPRDIFIQCCSFEERTDRVIKSINIKKSGETYFIFKYVDESKTNLRDKNYEEILNYLSKLTNNYHTILCESFSPTDGILQFKSLLNSLSLTLTGQKIHLDISCFSKLYLILLLKYIESCNPLTIRLFYTEPEEYAVKWDEPLTYGLVDVVSMPAFGGHYLQDRESLLVLLLGFDGDRAYGIWERFAPHRTIILIGKPSIRESWEGRVEKFNKRLMDRLPKESIYYLDSINPDSVQSSIAKIISKYNKKYNIMISPLGPKPQLLGCYLAIRDNKNIQLVYAFPKSYNERYFTKSAGNIWEYK